VTGKEKAADEVDRVLRAAGWQPGRQVDTTAWRLALESSGYRMHEAAERFLAEYGGIKVTARGPGISVAREPFEFDPLQADGEDDRFAEWGEEIGRTLFPVGVLDQGQFFLGISETGEVYLIADWLACYGPVPQALERLVLGIKADVIEE
jgi:hypothetical protein